MDRLELNAKARTLIEKYKYVLLVLLIGVLLMLLPERREEVSRQASDTGAAQELSQAAQLEEILAQISGVGKVRVLLTEAEGARTVYQTDQDRSTSTDSESLRIETVIITTADRSESGLIASVTPPVYLGAIIVCQGGDSPVIRLQVVEAVSNVTGISTERISVLKMK